MPRAHRYFLPHQVWHITHRCHQRDVLLKFARDRRRWRQWLVALSLVAGLTACAVPRAGIVTPDGSTVYDLYMRVEFVDEEYESVPVEPSPTGITLRFPYIPGQINGEFATRVLQTVHLTDAGPFRLDLAAMTGGIHRGATTLQDTPYTKGLSVAPPTTRFARVATLAEDAETGLGIGGGGFLDPASRDGMILLYVDRPCSITGTVDTSEFWADHDIHLARPGFHWLRGRRLGKMRFRYTADPGNPTVHFAVHIETRKLEL